MINFMIGIELNEAMSFVRPYNGQLTAEDDHLGSSSSDMSATGRDMIRAYCAYSALSILPQGVLSQ
jgi:hypothetical protein